MQHARATIARARTTPAGHTAFSWLRCAHRNRSIPKSHTSFSWLRFSTQSSGADGASDAGQAKSTVSYLVDVDANLLSVDLSGDGDVAFHIRAAEEVGVKRFVVPASSFGSNEGVLQLAADYEEAKVIVPCIGVHPFWTDVGDMWPGGEVFCEEKMQELREWVVANPAVAAIGECGLDKSPHFPSLDAQLPWFEAQVKLAAEVRACMHIRCFNQNKQLLQGFFPSIYGVLVFIYMQLRKPLFIHERLAFSEVMDMLSRFGFVSGTSSSSGSGSNHCPKVLVHCFTGTRDEMLQYVEAGFFIGISGFFLTKRGNEQLPWLKVSR